MLSPGKIEVRYHAAYRDEDVARMVRRLGAVPELSFLQRWQATHQGCALDLDSR
jgi:hypothetical protein